MQDEIGTVHRAFLSLNAYAPESPLPPDTKSCSPPSDRRRHAPTLMRTWQRIGATTLLLVLSLFVASWSMSAQSTAGRLMGTVSDSSGAVVNGAIVTVTNSGTGEHKLGRAGHDGNYVIFPIPPGTYDITVDQAGFSPIAIRNVIFDVNSEVVRNFKLTVGNISEQVTVNGDSAPMLNENISVESTVTAQQLNALPLNGRDFNQLVLLTPGATDNSVATGENLDFGYYSLNGNVPLIKE
jgi:hypothetical protein